MWAATSAQYQRHNRSLPYTSEADVRFARYGWWSTTNGLVLPRLKWCCQQPNKVHFRSCSLSWCFFNLANYLVVVSKAEKNVPADRQKLSKWHVRPFCYVKYLNGQIEPLPLWTYFLLQPALLSVRGAIIVRNPGALRSLIIVFCLE